MAHLLALGLAVSSVLLLTMRQDVRLHLLENRIATLRLDRLSLQRDLEERGRAIAARVDFTRMAPEIQALQLGSASSEQVLALTQLPAAVEEKRTFAGAILRKLSDLGEVRAAYPASRSKPTPAPDAPTDPEPEGIPESGGLW
jgi:hypothetical protein